MGQTPPEDDTAFIVLGRVNVDTVIDKHLLAGDMFLAWRCLYVEITRARIEKERNPDMGAAPLYPDRSGVHYSRLPGVRATGCTARTGVQVVQTTHTNKQRALDGPITARTERPQDG